MHHVEMNEHDSGQLEHLNKLQYGLKKITSHLSVNPHLKTGIPGKKFELQVIALQFLC